MSLFLSVLAVFAGFVLMVWLGRWILGPLDRAAWRRKHAVQFTMLDFLSLVFLLQLPLAVVHANLIDVRPRSVGVLDGFGCLAVSLIWWGSVRTLSRAGIHAPWRRFALVAVCIPLAYVGTFALPLVTVLLFTALADPTALGRGRVVVSSSAALVILVCGLFLVGRYIRTTAAETQE